MAEQESMGVVKASDRLEISWLGMDKRITGFKLPIKPKPDFAKLKAMMDKSGKTAEFLLTCRGGKFKVEVHVGSEVVVLATLDLEGESDLVKRREWLQKLRDGTDLVTTADLAAFDKRHPPPPDPVKVKELQDAVKMERGRIKIEQGLISTLPKKFATMNEGLREIGFKNWGKSKGIAPWIDYLNAVDAGRDADALVKEFLGPGVSPPLKMRPETRKAIDAAIAAGKKPDLSHLNTELTQLIDSGFVAKFSAEAKKSLETGIKEREVRAKKAEDALKAMGAKP